MSLPENLKKAREEAGLERAEFAEMLQLNPRTYAAYERGERDLSTALLLKICISLNVSSDYLLGINEQKNIAPSVSTESEYHDMLDNMTDDDLSELKAYAKILKTKHNYSSSDV